MTITQRPSRIGLSKFAESSVDRFSAHSARSPESDFDPSTPSLAVGDQLSGKRKCFWSAALARVVDGETLLILG